MLSHTVAAVASEALGVLGRLDGRGGHEDLLPGSHAPLEGELQEVELQEGRARRVLVFLLAELAREGREGEGLEIGRASCRERV